MPACRIFLRPPHGMRHAAAKRQKVLFAFLVSGNLA
jgi:hypothetical protein